MVKISIVPSPIFLFGLLLHCAEPALFAQSPATQPLSLWDAFERVSARNPELAALGHRQRAAEARVEQAGTRPLPSLDLGLENFAGTGPRQGIKELEITLQASQRIESGEKRTQRIALANTRSELESNSWSLRRSQLLARTAQAFVDAWAASRRFDLSQAEEQLNREALADAETRVSAGTASPAEVARARAAVVTAEVATSRAKSQWENARTTLASLWGESPDDLVITDAFNLPETLPDPADFLARLDNHPKLALQRGEITTRRSALEVERAETKPDLSVSGGVRFLSDGSDAAFVAGLSWPIGTRDQNQGNIRAARENLSEAEQSIRVIENQLRTSFSTAWQDLAATHRAVQTLRRDALPAIADAHAITTAAFHQGQIAWIEVLFTRQELMATRRRILDAEAEFAAAAVRIDALTTSQYSLTTSLLPTP